MSNIEKIKTIDKISSNKFLRIFLSALAIIGTLVTIYAAFFQEKNVNLEYIVQSNTNVLDINADISRLDILFDSTSLKSKKENIKILNLKIINSGNKDITIDYYDDNDPIGITLINGYIVDNPELVSTSSDYLKRNLDKKINLIDNNKIIFPKIILEAGEYFILKLLIIHKLNTVPQLLPIGKIASQKNIPIIQTIEAKKIPFIQNTFQGNIWVQLVRSIAYFLVIVLIIVGTIFSSDKIDDYKTKRTREKLISDFKNVKAYNYSRMDDAIFDRYKTEGEGFLEPMLALIKDQEKLNKNYTSIIEKIKKKPENKEDEAEYEYYSKVLYSKPKADMDFSLINKMINDGLVVKQGKVLIVNQTMQQTIVLFIDFLKEKKMYKKHRFFGGSVNLEIGN